VDSAGPLRVRSSYRADGRLDLLVTCDVHLENVDATLDACLLRLIDERRAVVDVAHARIHRPPVRGVRYRAAHPDATACARNEHHLGVIRVAARSECSCECNYLDEQEHDFLRNTRDARGRCQCMWRRGWLVGWF
jgi:hypothetical protein